MRGPRPRGLLAVVGLVTLLAACAPAGFERGATLAGQDQPRAPKVLTIGIQREPRTMHSDLAQGGDSGAAGVGAIRVIPHNLLVIHNDRDAFVPQLAAEELSVERGTWVVNSDGTMVTTWRLRPNIKWHDGAPFTSADLLFSYTVYRDPDIPVGTAAGTALRLMERVDASDPLSFVIYWSKPFVRADEALGLIPMPRHALEELYRTDKANFPNSPLFNTEFLGLGAYRLVRWELGSHVEFARFDDYYMGRPLLDAVLVRFLGDTNTMVANLLSGTVDVLLPIGVEVEQAMEVKRRWEGTGNEVRAELRGSIREVAIQHRPEFARPINGLTNRTVRQALYHAIDRQAMAEVMTHGLGPVADSWFPPNHELRPQLEAFIPKYPHDLARAQQILAQAGWTRGADGVLIHQSGERFELLIHADQAGAIEIEQNIVADGWKVLGAQINLYIIPNALRGDGEHADTLPGVKLGSFAMDRYYTDVSHSANISSAANRWTGRNRGGYANPRVDAALDKLQVTIDPRERVALHGELLREALTDVARMPLYWDVDPVLFVAGVKGINGRRPWNMIEWDKE